MFKGFNGVMCVESGGLQRGQDVVDMSQVKQSNY